MAPRDGGREYSRPICRRILEEAGMPRSAFGVHKKAVSVLHHQGDRLSPRSLADFRAWMDMRLACPDARGAVPRVWTALARSLSRLLKGIARLSPRHLCPLQSLGARVATYVSREPHRHLFTWALDRARRGYDTGAVSRARTFVSLRPRRLPRLVRPPQRKRAPLI